MKFINEWADIISNIMSVAGGASAALGTWLGGKYGGNAVSNSLGSIITFTKNVQKAAQGASAISNANALEVEEASLLELCAKFKGYHYTAGKSSGGKPVTYPYIVKGAGIPKTETGAVGYINCSTFIEALLVKCWHEEYGGEDFNWDRDDHKQMMIQNPEHPNSSVEITVAKGMAAKSITVQSPDSNAKNQMPYMQIQPWSIVQVWKWNKSDGVFTQRGNGHNFLVWKTKVDGQNIKILTLESNNSKDYSLPVDKSVGHRGVGEIEVSNNLVIEPNDWQAKVWTWEKFKQTYPEITVAKLNVTI